MSENSSVPPPSPAPPEGEGAPSANELEAIRQLLIGPEKQQLTGLQERLENPVLHSQDVSRVLPQAVALASAKGKQLSTALAPAVESALKESVRRDPEPVATAIFPILGPAIRRAIAETFSHLVQSLNQTLDHSFSFQGLKWRIEAARTGKSFAEVVLAHTLVYRVEQVFLIHKASGLLLAHVEAAGVQAMDPDMVSSMLTAIQDFARDSFHAPQGEALHTLEVGGLTVWIEPGPLASVAVATRGQVPREYRATLQAAVENIHREQSEALSSFAGDAAPFDLCRVDLESCLKMQTRQRKKVFPWKLLLLLLLLLGGIGVWSYFKIREHRWWHGYLERLKAEEGIVVTEAGKRGGHYYVAGLRDPLAADPAAFLAEFHLKPDQVERQWQPFQALTPTLVLRRAKRTLQPPPGVELSLRNGVLFVEGLAPGQWIDSARQRAGRLSGVERVNLDGLVDETAATLDYRRQEIEKTRLQFQDAVGLAPNQEPVLNTVADDILALYRATAARGKRLTVSVIGHTDRTGTDAKNLLLSRQRAEYIIGELVSRGVPAEVCVPVARGSREPVRPDLTDEEQILNRRVTLQVRWDAPRSGTP